MGVVLVGNVGGAFFAPGVARGGRFGTSWVEEGLGGNVGDDDGFVRLSTVRDKNLFQSYIYNDGTVRVM